ncbi:MAG: hypothetical protein KIC47_14290 [Clostridium sp.]|uniref:hypothetical protein n=1 Tax=Clostridium sp. TaxID=1506 RepID=UPI001DB62C85|nr:hypothetical protein [Clostridium sp.]MBS4804310.1 hypothetical protein [Clostridium sp.]MBS5940099.1 hypothetical protein [Clostridium sp.]MBS5951461.1 hypothetical protein [Clostridium sp.]
MGNKKEYTFSSEIDDKINGFSLALTFVIVGIGLSIVPNFFEISIVTEVIRWLFIIIGTLGFFVEISKTKKKLNVKGFSDLGAGILIAIIGVYILKLFNNIISKVIFFLFITFGLYATISGMLKVIYSIYENIRNSKYNNQVSKKVMLSDLTIFLTQILGLILVALQLLEVVK